MAGTLPIPTIGSANSIADPKVKESLETLNGKLNAENKLLGTNIAASAEITNAMLSAEAKPFDWYTPKIIATEQTRESASFGTLTTADEITGVVVPEGALVCVNYTALIKSSVGAAGKAAIFIGANQLKSIGTTIPLVAEATTSSTNLGTCSTSGSTGNGLGITGVGTSFVTTGMVTATGSGEGGPTVIQRLAAGTYAISIQFRATSGSVSVKERQLAVWVLGV